MDLWFEIAITVGLFLLVGVLGVLLGSLNRWLEGIWKALNRISSHTQGISR